MTSIDSSLRSRYLGVGHSPSGISLKFEPPETLTLGSQRRANEARRRVAGLLRRHRLKALRQGDAILAVIPPPAAGHLADLLEAIDAALGGFREERLHPRVVEEVLGITARERRRWTKDGRLPKSGSGSFRRGQQSIHFALHPAAGIAALAQQPERIVAWRNDDAGRSRGSVNCEDARPAP